MAYATLAELRSFVGIPASDTTDDTVLTLALDSASAQIDAFTGRYFTQDAGVVVRYYTASDDGAVDVAGISTSTGLIVRTDDNDDGVYETTWATTDYRLEPVNAGIEGRPWTRIVAVGAYVFPTGTRLHPGVQVTAKGGYVAVPAAVKQATLIQASRLFKRKDAPFGVAGTPEFGSELRLLSALDPDVQALVRGYKTNWVAV